MGKTYRREKTYFDDDRKPPGYKNVKRKPPSPQRRIKEFELDKDDDDRLHNR